MIDRWAQDPGTLTFVDRHGAPLMQITRDGEVLGDIAATLAEAESNHEGFDIPVTALLRALDRMAQTISRHGKPLLSCPINDAATNDTQEDRG